MCKLIWLPSAEPSSNNTACPQPGKPAMNWPYGRQQSAQMVHASGSSLCPTLDNLGVSRPRVDPLSLSHAVMLSFGGNF